VTRVLVIGGTVFVGEVVSREEGLRRALAWYAQEPPAVPKKAGNLDYAAEDAALVTIRGPVVL
jgi:hypothetical protein